MKGVSVKSEGMNSLIDFLKQYMATGEYQAMVKLVNEIRDEFMNIKLVLSYENNQLVVSQGRIKGTYEKFLDENFPNHPTKKKNPFLEIAELNELEQEIIKIVMKKNSELFKKMKEFQKTYSNYENQIVLQFASEITFYLSFYCFEEKMKEAGFYFSTPTVSREQKMEAVGLYDLALACANKKNPEKVVSNDAFYNHEEKFFVLTGPNQGGKTTFARSLGQLIYFGKMGLDVPAYRANIHYFKEILTHFSVEESVETGRGKLKEELKRLAPMMETEYEGAFVIINELFTTAANYDACIMGKNVLEHFMKQHCQGIYVTHLPELTEIEDGVVSIRASLDEHRLQNFKIVRGTADDTACAENQVNKYRLTYQQLKERLS